MLTRQLRFKLWSYGLFAVLVLAAAFYFILAKDVRTRVSTRLLANQLTLARAQSASITSFFQTFGESLAVFAKLGSLQAQDATTTASMAAFVDQWSDSGLVSGLILTDRDGKVLFNENVANAPDTGNLVSDRDYFVWASGQPSTGGYFIGKPVPSRLGASEDKLILPVASPVFVDGEFSGVVAAAVVLNPLIAQYLEQLKVSEQTQTFLVSDNAVLYGAGDTQLTQSALESFAQPVEGSFEGGGVLIAHAPIELGSDNMSVVTVTSDSAISELVLPIYVRQAAIFVLAIACILLFGLTTFNHAKKLPPLENSPLIQSGQISDEN